MATTTNITTTNAGDFAGDWISAMLLSLDMEGLTKKTGIKFQRVVKTLAHVGGLTDETCDFTDTGTTTIAERILTIKRLAKDVQYCKNDLYTDWNAGQEMGMNTLGESLPATFEKFMLEYHVGLVGQELSTTIWEGALGAGSFDGFCTLALADATVNDVAIPIALTAANIVAEMQRLIDECPTAVKSGTEKPLTHAGTDAVAFYKRSQQALGWSNLGNTSEIPLTIEGYTIIEQKGMAADKMIMTYPSNLWVGSGVDNEQDQVATKDMFESTLDRNYRVSFHFGLGVQHGIGADIAAYGL